MCLVTQTVQRSTSLRNIVDLTDQQSHVNFQQTHHMI
jgi:hypothetical protein